VRVADEEETLNDLQAMTRRLPLLAIAAMLALAALVPASAWAGGSHSHGHHDNGRHRGSEVDVMTRNLYLGAVLDPAVEAGSPEELAAADGQILREVVANDFPTRAKGLAQEILQTQPDLVGLQEVALWQSTPLSPTATPVNYDYLQLLLNQLNKGRGPRTEWSRFSRSSISKPRPT
jgi:hypothetical protein